MVEWAGASPPGSYYIRELGEYSQKAHRENCSSEKGDHCDRAYGRLEMREITRRDLSELDWKMEIDRVLVAALIEILEGAQGFYLLPLVVSRLKSPLLSSLFFCFCFFPCIIQNSCCCSII